MLELFITQDSEIFWYSKYCECAFINFFKPIRGLRRQKSGCVINLSGIARIFTLPVYITG